MRALAIGVLLAACGDGGVERAPGALGETRPAPVRIELDGLSPQAQAAVEQARLPIFVPRDPALRAAAIVTHGPHFSALSAAHDGVTLSVAGTDRRHENAEELAPIDPPEQVRGQLATFSANDLIRTVAWDEAGMAWAADLECADPEQDARCADDEHLRAIVEGLELAGGGP